MSDRRIHLILAENDLERVRNKLALLAPHVEHLDKAVASIDVALAILQKHLEALEAMQ